MFIKKEKSGVSDLQICKSNMQRYALVTKDIPAHCAVAGNPAKIVKENILWEE